MVTTASIRLTRKEFQASAEMREELERLLKAGEQGPPGVGPASRLQSVVGDMEEVAVSFLDYLPRLRRLWQRVDSDQATEMGEYRKGVELLLELCREGSAHLERFLADMTALERKGYQLNALTSLRAGLEEVQQMTARAEKLVAWLNEPTPPFDPAMAEQARKDYEAGDYQTVAELIRELQADHSQGN